MAKKLLRRLPNTYDLPRPSMTEYNLNHVYIRRSIVRIDNPRQGDQVVRHLKQFGKSLQLGGVQIDNFFAVRTHLYLPRYRYPNIDHSTVTINLECSMLSLFFEIKGSCCWQSKFLSLLQRPECRGHEA
jgi:hypothetical protein